MVYHYRMLITHMVHFNIDTYICNVCVVYIMIVNRYTIDTHICNMFIHSDCELDV